MTTPLRFCAVFLGAVMAFAAAVAVLNVAVDPYLLFNVPRFAGFNASKPVVKTRERLIKSYAAPRVAPRTVILGSSRCDIGLDPASAVWKASDRPIYNLSLPGSDLAQLTLLLQHVIALNPPADRPRTAIVCLDFEFFLPSPTAAGSQAAGPDEFRERLAVLENGQPNRRRILRMAKDYVKAVLSMSALADSLLTIGANALPETWNITPDGHLVETIFRRAIALDGMADLFAAENVDAIHRYSTRQAVGDMSDGAMDRLVAVRNLVEIGQANGMSIVFAIQPSHADWYEIFDRLGYWEDYERWKRTLAQLIAAERAQGAAVSLWDFAGYEAFSLERVPASKDRASRLKWFWDPVHYTTALGDIMLARMLGRESPVPYGVELTPENVDGRLAAVRRAREAYRAQEPGEAQRRATLFAGGGAVGQATIELWHEDATIFQLARFWELTKE